MKNRISFVLFVVLLTGFSLSCFSEKGPLDPGGKGNGIFGFGFGPGVPFYGGSGFGPAIIIHYDHGIWKAGPGTISLGGQIGASFFWHDYSHQDISYKYKWTNLGFVFRGAYHYGWNVPGLDSYAGFGAGTWISMYNNGGYNEGKKRSEVGFMPTVFLGGTYFFNPLIGLNAEFGLNFAYASIGLNFRISK